MATPVPKSMPRTEGMAGLVALVAMVLLVGAEYYYLTLRDAQRRLPVGRRVAVAAQPQTSRKAGPAGKVPALDAGKSAGSKPQPGQPVPLDIGKMFGGAAGDGPGLLDRGLQKVDELEAVGAGLGLRAFFVAVCLGLLVLQKPPAPKVGEMRRRARNPKDIAKPMQYIYVLLGYGSVAMLGVGSATGGVLTYGYPLAAGSCLLLAFMGGFLRASTVPEEGPLMPEKRQRPGDYTIVLRAQGGRYVNVPNPFRGTLVLGGAGAGKTYSIGEPFLEQFLQKGMCGIIYDFKFPVLAGAAQKALLYAQPAHQKLLQQYQDNLKKGPGKNGIVEGLQRPIRHRVINFVHMDQTEKVNPLRAQDMPTQAYAIEYADTILTNLSAAGAKGGDDFFSSSAQAYLTGIIWYYRKNYPALCTIPHVVATALYKEYTHVLHMLRQDHDCAVLVQSLITAVEEGADKQISGVVSTLQVKMARLATAEIAWVLAPDEDPALGDEAEGFSLDLNDPKNPTILTIGNDPTLSKTFAPVISCIVAVALKLMNQQRKHPSFVLVDEGATIYVPGLEVIPATARSNRVAMLYMTQDIAQLNDAYGKDKTQVLVSNLNNQFIGKVNSAETARLVQDMIGTRDTEVVSVNSGQSMGSSGSTSKGQSVSIQEKKMFRMQDAFTLRQGEFVGQTVETDPNNFFLAQFERDVEPGEYPIAQVAFFKAERGLVDDRTRREYLRLKQEDLQRLAEQTRQDSLTEQQQSREWQQATQPLREQLTAGRRRRSSVRFDPNASADKSKLNQINPPDQKSKPDQSTQITQDSEKSKLSQSTQINQQSEATQVSQPTQIPDEAEQEPDWAWEEKINVAPDEPPAQGPQFQPTDAEEALLENLAARSRHARKRITMKPTAGAPDGQSDQAEVAEPGHDMVEVVARALRAKARLAERTTQSREKRNQSVMADMIEANYSRIREEVVIAITNSGDNSLSKAALAKKQNDAKLAANRQGPNPLEG